MGIEESTSQEFNFIQVGGPDDPEALPVDPGAIDDVLDADADPAPINPAPEGRQGEATPPPRREPIGLGDVELPPRPPPVPGARDAYEDLIADPAQEAAMLARQGLQQQIHDLTATVQQLRNAQRQQPPPPPAPAAPDPQPAPAPPAAPQPPPRAPQPPQPAGPIARAQAAVANLQQADDAIANAQRQHIALQIGQNNQRARQRAAVRDQQRRQGQAARNAGLNQNVAHNIKAAQDILKVEHDKMLLQQQMQMQAQHNEIVNAINKKHAAQLDARNRQLVAALAQTNKDHAQRIANMPKAPSAQALAQHIEAVVADATQKRMNEAAAKLTDAVLVATGANPRQPIDLTLPAPSDNEVHLARANHGGPKREHDANVHSPRGTQPPVPLTMTHGPVDMNAQLQRAENQAHLDKAKQLSGAPLNPKVEQDRQGPYALPGPTEPISAVLMPTDDAEHRAADRLNRDGHHDPREPMPALETETGQQFQFQNITEDIDSKAQDTGALPAPAPDRPANVGDSNRPQQPAKQELRGAPPANDQHEVDHATATLVRPRAPQHRSSRSRHSHLASNVQQAETRPSIKRERTRTPRPVEAGAPQDLLTPEEYAELARMEKMDDSRFAAFMGTFLRKHQDRLQPAQSSDVAHLRDYARRLLKHKQHIMKNVPGYADTRHNNAWQDIADEVRGSHPSMILHRLNQMDMDYTGLKGLLDPKTYNQVEELAEFMEDAVESIRSQPSSIESVLSQFEDKNIRYMVQRAVIPRMRGGGGPKRRRRRRNQVKRETSEDKIARARRSRSKSTARRIRAESEFGQVTPDEAERLMGLPHVKNMSAKMLRDELQRANLDHTAGPKIKFEALEKHILLAKRNNPKVVHESLKRLENEFLVQYRKAQSAQNKQAVRKRYIDLYASRAKPLIVKDNDYKAVWTMAINALTQLEETEQKQRAEKAMLAGAPPKELRKLLKDDAFQQLLNAYDAVNKNETNENMYKWMKYIEDDTARAKPRAFRSDAALKQFFSHKWVMSNFDRIKSAVQVNTGVDMAHRDAIELDDPKTKRPARAAPLDVSLAYMDDVAIELLNGFSKGHGGLFQHDPINGKAKANTYRSWAKEHGVPRPVTMTKAGIRLKVSDHAALRDLLDTLHKKKLDARSLSAKQFKKAKDEASPNTSFRWPVLRELYHMMDEQKWYDFAMLFADHIHVGADYYRRAPASAKGRAIAASKPAPTHTKEAKTVHSVLDKLNKFNKKINERGLQKISKWIKKDKDKSLIDRWRKDRTILKRFVDTHKSAGADCNKWITFLDDWIKKGEDQLDRLKRRAARDKGDPPPSGSG